MGRFSIRHLPARIHILNYCLHMIMWSKSVFITPTFIKQRRFLLRDKINFGVSCKYFKSNDHEILKINANPQLLTIELE